MGQKWKYHLRFSHLNSFVGNHRLNILSGNNFWEKSIIITEAAVPKSDILWSFRKHYRAILKPFWSHSRVIQESFWNLSGGHLWVILFSHSIIIQQSFQQYYIVIPVIPESFYCHSSHFWVILFSFQSFLSHSIVIPVILESFRSHYKVIHKSRSITCLWICNWFWLPELCPVFSKGVNIMLISLKNVYSIYVCSTNRKGEAKIPYFFEDNLEIKS